MNDDGIYVHLAAQELINPTFEVTKQYLNVMEVEIENEFPKVARVNYNHEGTSSVAVYFHIKDERFFIVVNLSVDQEPKVEWVWVESGHRVYLTAYSMELNYEELSSYLPLSPLKGWSKGDVRTGSAALRKFSNVSYEPNVNEAFGLEEKLLELLKKLESYSESIIKLGENSKAYISICKHQAMCGNKGIHLNMEILKRLSFLNLELDIDTYIVGNDVE